MNEDKISQILNAYLGKAWEKTEESADVWLFGQLAELSEETRARAYDERAKAECESWMKTEPQKFENIRRNSLSADTEIFITELNNTDFRLDTSSGKFRYVEYLRRKYVVQPSESDSVLVK